MQFLIEELNFSRIEKMSERYPFLNPDAEMAREFNRLKEAEVAQVAKSGQQFNRLGHFLD